MAGTIAAGADISMAGIVGKDLTCSATQFGAERLGLERRCDGVLMSDDCTVESVRILRGVGVNKRDR